MCVLRACGREFVPEAFLEGSPLRPIKMFRRGDPVLPGSDPGGRVHEFSGINLEVSDGAWSSLDQQVDDAVRFLSTHESALARLAAQPGIEDVRLDFPLDSRLGGTTVAQCEFFPPELLALAGRLGIGIELTVYAVGEGEGD